MRNACALFNGFDLPPVSGGRPPLFGPRDGTTARGHAIPTHRSRLATSGGPSGNFGQVGNAHRSVRRRSLKTKPSNVRSVAKNLCGSGSQPRDVPSTKRSLKARGAIQGMLRDGLIIRERVTWDPTLEMLSGLGAPGLSSASTSTYL
jgi:hypothetical protein